MSSAASCLPLPWAWGGYLGPPQPHPLCGFMRMSFAVSRSSPAKVVFRARLASCKLLECRLQGGLFGV